MAEVENADLTSPLHKYCKIFKGFYDPEIISATDPDKRRFLFGDNVLRTGKGGQAVIRDCNASFGIATKWRPNNSESSFFTDENLGCWDIIYWDLLRLKTVIELASKEYDDYIVYFPEGGLGTGLSQLPERAPKTYKKLVDTIKETFGVDYGYLSKVS